MAAAANLKQAVPFFGVTDMVASHRFWVGGLGFEVLRQWLPDRPEDQPDGGVRWCWLQRGGAAVMLQTFGPGRPPEGTLGVGTSVTFTCEDALALHRELRERGVEPRRRPFVGNGLWVVQVLDPDGYRLEFASPTDAPEDSELADGAS